MAAQMITEITVDELKETFIDINSNVLIDLHEDLKTSYMDLGILNHSECHEFINMLADNIQLNVNDYESSSDEEH